MFPLNPAVVGKDGDEYDYERVLERCGAENIETLCIKAFAEGPWPPTDELPEADRPYANWYRPVETPDWIQERFDFAAAQGVTSAVTPGDPKLVRWSSMRPVATMGWTRPLNARWWNDCSTKKVQFPRSYITELFMESGIHRFHSTGCRVQ
nr:hypothetical protein [Halogeometricum borinquense]